MRGGVYRAQGQMERGEGDEAKPVCRFNDVVLFARRAYSTGRSALAAGTAVNEAQKVKGIAKAQAAQRSAFYDGARLIKVLLVHISE